MISVIIPTFNEAQHIGSTICAIKKNDAGNKVTEIIIADAESTDGTTEIARVAGCIIVNCTQKGRGSQMNRGAAVASNAILYFLHADTTPPFNFSADITGAIANNYMAGCFTLAFDVNHWFLKANCWFTRFDVNYFRFGDQSLFVANSLFNKCSGFKEHLIVMEDQELVQRLRKQTRFKIIKKTVVTSARKYRVNGIYRTQAIFFLIFFMYQLGYSQQKLVATYKKLIRQDKL